MDIIKDHEIRDGAVVDEEEEEEHLLVAEHEDEDDDAHETHEKNNKIEAIVKDNVLSLLPAKSLSKFKTVSKDWKYRISRPLLAHEQSYRFKELSGFFFQNTTNSHLRSFITLNRDCYGVPMPELGFLPPETNEITIVSSCNGLLLCQVSTDFDTSLYVCNPATKQWKHIPKPEYGVVFKMAAVLAFEPSIHNIEANYHIICAVDGVTSIFFEIYSSQTASWAESKAASIELGGSIFTGDGYYINGCCYWEMEARKVLAYDLKYDIYSVINLASESPRHGILAQIRGELSYIVSGEEGCIFIYGGTMDMGLRQRIDFRLELNYGEVRGRKWRVLSCADDATMLILCGSMVYSYNSTDRRIEVKCEVGVGGGDVEEGVRYLPYVNSLATVA